MDDEFVADGQAPPFETARLCLQDRPGTPDRSTESLGHHPSCPDDSHLGVQMGDVEIEAHADGVDRARRAEQQGTIA